MARQTRFLMPFQQGDVALPAQDMLVIRPNGPDGLAELPRAGLVLEQGFKVVSDRLQHAGFNVVPRSDKRHALTLVFLTRSKQESLANIARASRITDGVVLVDGAKTDGIESVLKQVKRHCAIAGTISKSHGKVFWFQAGASFPDWEKQGEAGKNSAGFITAPGMFSADRIDRGSALLAPQLQGLTGRVADFGAGWGWLAYMALAQNPEITRLDLFEADYHALQAARLNVPDPRAGFVWADIQTMAAPADPFDAIICNPPFHHSRDADSRIGVDFITRAAASLRRKGRLLLVANRHLPYEATLSERFKSVKTVQETSGFKLFSATSPR